MMLTKKEANWIRVLIKQVPNDVDYMRPHLRDHHSHFTQGHCERYEEMGRWLKKMLEAYEAESEIMGLSGRGEGA